MTANRSKGEILIKVWETTGVIIILGFFVFSMIIGGSTGLGYQENGHYFVRDHGDVAEVSEVVWTISGIWEILFWIFIPLTPICAFVISNIQEKIERRKNRFEQRKAGCLIAFPANSFKISGRRRGSSQQTSGA